MRKLVLKLLVFHLDRTGEDANGDEANIDDVLNDDDSLFGDATTVSASFSFCCSRLIIPVGGNSFGLVPLDNGDAPSLGGVW